MKRQLTVQEKIFINHLSDKKLISKIHEEIIQFYNIKQPTNLIKKWAKELKRLFPKEFKFN